MNVIEIENVSKKYILSHKNKKGYSVKEGFEKFTKNLFSKKEKDSKEEFWALKNISLEIAKGDRLGLIGSNGAGKSTLLKVLSQITEPTTGTIKIRGRMASLLEVGTGFHPELSGRENIHLNGAILGMRKHEIEQHFDAIVDFAGIEKFLDTPVKRYSSGMYVRLGFAIAAHLEPEILVVDEVLAVGDADFQKKSIGKMRDVSSSGRTILFVSHNLTAVEGLCNKGVYLRNGEIVKHGDVLPVINHYVSSVSKFQMRQTWETFEIAPGNDMIKAKRVELKPMNEVKHGIITTKNALKVEFEFWSSLPETMLNVSLFLYTMTGECIFNVANFGQQYKSGIIETECTIPGDFLNDGSYYISLMVVEDQLKPLYFFEEVLAFDVKDSRDQNDWLGKWPGAIRPMNIEVISRQKEFLDF